MFYISSVELIIYVFFQICLDNTMSTWSDKVVWFEVTVHDPKDDYYDDYIGECRDLSKNSVPIFLKYNLSYVLFKQSH